ncbi:MAG TPA: hypothetical protein VG410_05085 [Solirubrobacteraceae bacterium]|nr:hypothetical protein [Solirubrobacteraceae bacterium]
MAWVETSSPSFRARHEAQDAADAGRILFALEALREQLSAAFPRTVEGVTIVLHPSVGSLSFARPLLPLMWFATAPAARRYVAGWATGAELHVLRPAALLERASNVPGSREMLERTPAVLYARLVINENNRDLSSHLTPARINAELRWGWLLEGGARWFGGQTEHARPAIARRMHEGRRPSFPPGLRDAPLLGGTVIDLLAREEGIQAAAQFVSRLHPQGGRAALAKAFGGRALVHTEGTWRAHLARMAGG